MGVRGHPLKRNKGLWVVVFFWVILPAGQRWDIQQMHCNVILYPRCSMEYLPTFVKLKPNVGKYSIHGAYGYLFVPYLAQYTGIPAMHYRPVRCHFRGFLCGGTAVRRCQATRVHTVGPKKSGWPVEVGSLSPFFTGFLLHPRWSRISSINTRKMFYQIYWIGSDLRWDTIYSIYSKKKAKIRLTGMDLLIYPIGSMDGIYAYIYHKGSTKCR